MSEPTIYESDYPVPFLPQQSLFHYIFPDGPGVSPLPRFSPALPAYIDGLTGRTLTRGQVEDGALRLASGLRALGLQRGETACIWGLNSLEWTIAAWGCVAAGLIVSPANASYAPHELAHQMNDSGASFIFLSPELVPQFAKARAELQRDIPSERIVLLCEPHRKSSVPGGDVGTDLKCVGELFGERHPAESFDHDPMATAWLCYSSGTTGLPKGVMTSHYNLTSQLQASAVALTKLEPGKDTVLGFLPFSHVYGSILIMVQPLQLGVPVVILPRFDEVAMLRAIQDYKITFAFTVPPVLVVLNHSQTLKSYDLSSLHTVVCAAAPISPALAKTMAQRLNVAILQGYGMTETSPTATAMNSEQAKGRYNSVGRLIPTYQARLVTEDGTDAAPGERGEIWLRGPSIMKGYHNNPEATAKTILPGGWLRTGDILTRDKKGWFKVVDRQKELIKYKGFQELEALLLQHPKVVDTGVVGVYDEKNATELPRAYVVPDPRTKATLKTATDRARYAKDIRAYVAKQASSPKHLRGGVVVVDVIPKSPSGKILRKDLRARAAEEWGKDAKAKL